MRLSPLELVLAIVSLAVATLATRSGVLIAGERFAVSRRVDAALRFAPGCALTALVLPEVLYPAGTFDLSLTNPRWPAALAAVAFLIWRPNVAGGISVGMLVYGAIRLWA